uniref:Ornithine decarboxylase antizyme 2b n=1 Tax=Sinocyclocheilus rhinocerous TaxID=307959 RepID=A0A673FS33_9TELE
MNYSDHKLKVQSSVLCLCRAVLVDSAGVLRWVRQQAPGPQMNTAGQSTSRDLTQDVLLYKDGKLTVKQQVTSLDSESSILHFQYQLSEQLSWSMQTVLSGRSLFVGLPNGELLKGTKEGHCFASHK